MRLGNRVAIITGGANGIGRETAFTFAREGAQLMIADYDTAAGQEICAQLREKGAEAAFHQVDVSSRESVQKMVEATVEHFQKIDILINNAGITHDGMLVTLTEEQWRRVIEVNLNGVFFCTQAVVPHMIKQGRGRIISASSVSGVYGNIGQTNYAATKAGVVGMTKSWAKELARHGLRVNAIAPGFVQTRMVETVPQTVLEQVQKQIPVGRLGKPSDIAHAYLFLASDEADYINGTVLHVDGGIIM
ncbi:3-oxoacyl-ACP reductase FabG [Paenactinomyces guangxiensis]|uniref:3-oxoacyl-[acyl-carrier-protein] reductase n=1 Tax=Paenactinomyces guangxiensis TaxID=1490290 RepID=A0A7W2A848_9BACL|nr:3-oxoacyl-ACP reductase FabG [Paenactinomyces guangxiensis]MBA4495226.1 3-oxoacyl-ACP reductase FabG [Paenactinomyces guangxiensis]MBH8592310.1 3-oxoacyl-ACP reductase FabG [Paenactinomyces guangxiensis]